MSSRPPHDEGENPTMVVPAAPPADRPVPQDAVAGPPVPARERWLSLIEVILCSGYPTQILLAVVLHAAGVAANDAQGNIRLDFVVLLSLADAALVVALVWVFLRLRGERPAAVLLGMRRPAREVLIGLGLVPLLLAMAALLGFIVQRYAPWLHNVPTNPFETLLESAASAAVFAVVAIFAGGVREELQRAFVLHRFEQHLGGARLGLVIFSAAFGFGHLLQGYDAALLTGIFGVVWGVVYLWRRSILAPVVSHATFNTVEVVFHALDLA